MRWDIFPAEGRTEGHFLLLFAVHPRSKCVLSCLRCLQPPPHSLLHFSLSFRSLRPRPRPWLLRAENIRHYLIFLCRSLIDSCMDGSHSGGGGVGGGGGETPDERRRRFEARFEGGGGPGRRWFCNGLLRFCLESGYAPAYSHACIPESDIVL